MVNFESTPIITLTPEQILAVEFLTGSEKIVLLKGAAGTGKTTLIQAICSKYNRVMVTAPTNQAVKILRNKTKVECKTIHSHHKLKRTLVGHKYEYLFNPDNKIDVNFDVLIVDEASMLTDYLIDTIILCAKDNYKVIFVGDNRQLNPIGEENSPVFHKNYPEIELTDIIRHRNDIIDLSRNIDWLYSKRNGESFKWLEKANFPVQLLIDANGSNQCKFITWTNKIVEIVNREVRKAIYINPSQIEIGEYILLNSHYGDNYRNNDEILVDSLSNDVVNFYDADIPHKQTRTLVINEDLVILDNRDIEIYKNNCKVLIEMCKLKITSWKNYYGYKELFCEYQYNHAITVHKSQGSTFETSIVNITDIMRNPNQKERRRMLYTAVTRASKQNLLL